jgi:hypothetical protein
MGTMMLILDWLEWSTPFRQLGVYMIWFMFPVQLWSVWRAQRQNQQWWAEDAARRERWKEDMLIVGQMRDEAHQLRTQAQQMKEEAGHLRIQTEIALAQARRHLPLSGAAD